jgi:hypothetical protein
MRSFSRFSLLGESRYEAFLRSGIIGCQADVSRTKPACNLLTPFERSVCSQICPSKTPLGLVQANFAVGSGTDVEGILSDGLDSATLVALPRFDGGGVNA